jgi:hypothetical protein
MVPERYRLASVGRFLLEAFERRRPGLTAWSPEVEQGLLAEAEASLQEMERQCRELGLDDQAYWQKVRGVVRDVLLPRYAVIARREIELARAEYHLWRGGDLVARGAFALVGLVLGVIAVEVPQIPVSEKWVPWALFVAGPFLPDAQLWLFRKRLERRLQALVDDLARADQSLETYRPISELARVMAQAEAAAPPPAEADRQPQAQAPQRLEH